MDVEQSLVTLFDQLLNDDVLVLEGWRQGPFSLYNETIKQSWASTADVDWVAGSPTFPLLGCVFGLTPEGVEIARAHGIDLNI